MFLYLVYHFSFLFWILLLLKIRGKKSSLIASSIYLIFILLNSKIKNSCTSIEEFKKNARIIMLITDRANKSL